MEGGALCGGRRRSRLCGFLGFLFKLFLHLAAVADEFPRWREFAEVMPDHFLGDQKFDENAAVMHGETMPNHLGRYRRAPRPRLDDGFVANANAAEVFQNARMDVRSFLEGSRHIVYLRMTNQNRITNTQRSIPVSHIRNSLKFVIRRTHDLRFKINASDRWGLRVFTPPVTLPHAVFGRRGPRCVRPSPPPPGGSRGVMTEPRARG